MLTKFCDAIWRHKATVSWKCSFLLNRFNLHRHVKYQLSIDRGFCQYDDVIKWKRFPRYWPSVRRIQLLPVSSPHKGTVRQIWSFLLWWLKYAAHVTSPNWKHSQSWWRHQMEIVSVLPALCVGNSPVNSPHKGQWRGVWCFLWFAPENTVE